MAAPILGTDNEGAHVANEFLCAGRGEGGGCVWLPVFGKPWLVQHGEQISVNGRLCMLAFLGTEKENRAGVWFAFLVLVSRGRGAKLN